MYCTVVSETERGWKSAWDNSTCSPAVMHRWTAKKVWEKQSRAHVASTVVVVTQAATPPNGSCSAPHPSTYVFAQAAIEEHRAVTETHEPDENGCMPGYVRARRSLLARALKKQEECEYSNELRASLPQQQRRIREPSSGRMRARGSGRTASPAKSRTLCAPGTRRKARIRAPTQDQAARHIVPKQTQHIRTC
ncbi:hypothetical protein HPB50_000327 [Hyalomma asiaticum]|uniref:Uncharacterized protein n=1 Tax=Hyalomma asiaticum TaxID=266040 RepID=A0ACB7RSD4_HYAAI|nr:hypothetical protein HPB50_000327 [Hyalomma asiaticum]